MGRHMKFGLAGLGLFALALALQMAAREITGFADWYARRVYPVLVGIIGRFFGIFPFSVVEIALYLLALWFVLYAAVVAIRFRRPGRLIGWTVFLAGEMLFVYTVNCGINYHAVSFSEYAGLTVETYTKEELVNLCEYLTEQVNETVTEERYRESAASQRAWRQEGVRAMQAAAEEFPALAGFYPQPKELAVSWILSVQQLCGVYSPFTIEANFNGEMPNYNIPHTICHELSHLRGFMREDEANFIGYLACILSESQAFRYSGYLTGWVYAGNALARVDMEAYRELAGQLCAQAQSDLDENNRFWAHYDGKAAEVSTQVNDAYLKINRQTDGVQSYGRMVDLMLEYYRNDLQE
ncbi:MAG: DUF3810 domain-containing protein [Clostridiales bacterium]|nr:DUF3810 domain-containing protein [Clostridiales bacterium]